MLILNINYCNLIRKLFSDFILTNKMGKKVAIIGSGNW